MLPMFQDLWASKSIVFRCMTGGDLCTCFDPIIVLRFSKWFVWLNLVGIYHFFAKCCWLIWNEFCVTFVSSRGLWFARFLPHI